MAASFDLQAFVPYLLNRAVVRIVEAFGEELKRHDLTVPMWRVLAALWHDGPSGLSELADLTAIEISTLSRLVTTLQRKELVSRVRSDADARAVRLDLTEQGRALTATVIPLALECERRTLIGLSEDEVSFLRRLLHRVYKNAAGLDFSTEPLRKAG
jgi:MarR family transcriptional regulator, organic hydroperoxide resistance regulator